MKTLDIAETVKTATPIMDRTQRLQHWATLVRCFPSNLLIFHRLEHWTREQLQSGSPREDSGPYTTAFCIAENDPVFAAQGLKMNATFSQHMEFFSLTQSQLHEFSCDCGGHISNAEMADRIERLAMGSTPGPIARVVNGITQMIR